MTVLPYASNVERRIAKAIVTDALAKGWTVSVHDGEEWALAASADKAAILSAMGSTDSDTLRFRTSSGEKIGSIYLVWGNEEDLLSDHTDVAPLNEFVAAGRYH